MTLVLVDGAGRPAGVLPPFAVAIPWWQDVSEFGRAVQVPVQVLRLLHAERPAPPGGPVTYLAEVAGPAPAALPARGDRAVDLSPHPRRAAYARPGGPAASMAWARDALDRPGVTFHQQRTWNLSAIWRVDGPDGVPVAWLKQVPGFAAHEPAAIALAAAVNPALVPPLRAAGHGRMLIDHLPGKDCYGAGPELRERIIDAFHPVQAHCAGRPAPGIPVARLAAAEVAEPFYDAIPGLRALIDDLPRRLAEVEACGLPPTLVHGDLHPGNVRRDGHGRLTIIDWADSTVDHPAYDVLRLTEDLPDPAPLLALWARRWRDTVPGCDPLRAVDLLRPVAALRAAGVYAAFLDAVEPAERPYHAADVPACLAAAASMVEG